MTIHFEDFSNCEAWSEDAQDFCCREEGHHGPHQTRICDGTCDHCSCVEWGDQPEAERPATEAARG